MEIDEHIQKCFTFGKPLLHDNANEQETSSRVEEIKNKFNKV